MRCKGIFPLIRRVGSLVHPLCAPQIGCSILLEVKVVRQSKVVPTEVAMLSRKLHSIDIHRYAISVYSPITVAHSLLIEFSLMHAMRDLVSL